MPTECSTESAAGYDHATIGGAGSLFRRYLLWVGASVFVLMTANGVVQSLLVWRDTEAALHERHRGIADTAARRIGAALDDKVSQMAAALRHLQGWAHLDPALRQLELYRLLKGNRMFSVVRLQGLDGAMVAQAGRLTNDAGLAVDERSRADAAIGWPVPITAGEPTYGDVFLLRQSEPRVRVSLLGDRQQATDTGLILSAEISLESLGSLLRELKPSTGAALYLVDTERRILVHSEPSRSLAALTWRQLHPFAAPPAPGITLQVAHDGAAGHALLSSAAAPALQAVLVLDEPRREAWAPVRAAIVRSILATVVALLLATIAATVMARRMRGLLLRLARAQARIRAQSAHVAALNTALTQRSDEAERANQAKTRFIAAASHDLRQPLHTVALLSDVLIRRLGEGEDRVLAIKLQEAVGAMDRLFQGILDLSKLEAGVVKANPKPISLEPLLRHIAAQTAPLAEAHGIKLRIHAGPRLGLISDPMLLERILLNLVVNAIRYTAPGGGVLLGCRLRGQWVRIEVWDTGRGIPAEQQAQVFEAFVQLHDPHRDREQGVGLGLAVVHRLADLLGHGIGLRSRPGRGSCFHVDVPTALSTLPRAASADIPPAAPTNLAALAGCFVVLVDDDVMVRAAMQAVFAEWGCPCVDAPSASEAIVQLQHHDRTPDLLICDHRPGDGASGPAAVAALRAALDAATLPALVLTGNVEAEEAPANPAAKMALLRKPVGEDRLASVLAGLLSDSTGPAA